MSPPIFAPPKGRRKATQPDQSSGMTAAKGRRRPLRPLHVVKAYLLCGPALGGGWAEPLNRSTQGGGEGAAVSLFVPYRGLRLSALV